MDMTTGHVFIATSLDGFVARKDHDLDWLMRQDTTGEDHGYEAFMAGVDGLIMGSNSFRKVLSFEPWPYEKPVVVMSQRLTPAEVPEALGDRVRLSREQPAALMASLAQEGWRRAYVDGGQVIQSFLRAGLIEDMILTVVPVLIGEGLRLFGPLDQDQSLKLLASKSFPSGLVRNHYQVV